MKKSVLKRLLTLGMALSMSTAALAGCGGGSGGGSVDADSVDETAPVTIKVGIWAAAGDAAGLENWANYEASMKEKYPNITLQPEAYSYSSDTFVPMAVSGTAPNIFSCPFTEPDDLIASGYVADITSFAKKYNLFDTISSTMSGAATVDGKLYGLPRDGYALSLMLNMDLYRKAGLVDANGLPIYPKTFDELATTAKTIKDKTGKAGLILTTQNKQGGWQFSNIAWAYGANLQYQDENGKWQNGLASEPAVQALDYLKKLRWDLNVLPDNTLIDLATGYQLFATGEGAMMFCGSDAFNNPVRSYGMNKDDIAVVPIPAGPGGQYSLLGGVMYMFAENSTANQLDACFKLLNVIGYSPDASEEVMTAIEDEIKVRESNGYAIGPRSLNIWTSQERLDAEQAIYDRYTNVNMDLYQPFYDKVYDTLKSEEPNYCQNMYTALDVAIQKVMNDQSADTKALLQTASNDFQNYLGQLN